MKLIHRLSSLILFIFSPYLLALNQNGEAWLDISMNNELMDFEKIFYLLEAQTRFINHKNYYEFTLFQGGLGYQASKNLSFWAGYQWIGKNVITDRPRSNQLWQQMVWQAYKNDTFVFRTRTLFEQINLMHEPQWENRVREKLSLYFPEKFYFNWTPLIYNEIFIKLNDPEWANTKTFEENRLFIGMDIPIGNTVFIETGYLQQAIFNTNGNELNHILYIGFNINTDRLPFPQYVK